MNMLEKSDNSTPVITSNDDMLTWTAAPYSTPVIATLDSNGDIQISHNPIEILGSQRQEIIPTCPDSMPFWNGINCLPIVTAPDIHNPGHTVGAINQLGLDQYAIRDPVTGQVGPIPIQSDAHAATRGLTVNPYTGRNIGDDTIAKYSPIATANATQQINELTRGVNATGGNGMLASLADTATAKIEQITNDPKSALPLLIGIGIIYFVLKGK